MYCTQRREAAKIIGMRVQFGLALECREIIVADRFLPFFFVLFVAFVVILLVAANGCSELSAQFVGRNKDPYCLPPAKRVTAGASPT